MRIINFEELFTKQLDKFTDLRLHLLKLLESYVLKDELSQYEAVRLFARATLWTEEKSAQYLSDMGSAKIWRARKPASTDAGTVQLPKGGA